MLTIKDTSTVPQEGWQYKIEATGYTVTTRNYSRLYYEVVKHCTGNNIPAPSEQDVINCVCANQSVPCYDGLVPLVNKWSLNIPAPRALGSCCKEVNVAPLPVETI